MQIARTGRSRRRQGSPACRRAMLLLHNPGVARFLSGTPLSRVIMLHYRKAANPEPYIRSAASGGASNGAD